MKFSPAKTSIAAGSPAVPEIDAYRARHLALNQRRLETEFGSATVTVDAAESPLAWLARRRGRDGRAMITPHQLQAGDRLRADFTRAHLMPRTTSNWPGPSRRASLRSTR